MSFSGDDKLITYKAASISVGAADVLMYITTKNRIMFLVILTLACGENSYLHLFAECFALKSAKRTMQKNNINLF